LKQLETRPCMEQSQVAVRAQIPSIENRIDR